MAPRANPVAIALSSDHDGRILHGNCTVVVDFIVPLFGSVHEIVMLYSPVPAVWMLAEPPARSRVTLVIQ